MSLGSLVAGCTGSVGRSTQNPAIGLPFDTAGDQKSKDPTGDQQS